MMIKRFYNILWAGLLGMAGVSCEQDYPAYASADCNLNFVYYDIHGNVMKAEKVTDKLRTYSFSFIYSGELAERDTLTFEVSSMGELVDCARPIALEQVQAEGVENAVPGVHYVAFDEPSEVEFNCIPANRNKGKVRVILLRNDRELKKKDVVLRFGFKENADFKPGFEGLTRRDVVITDRIARPSNWVDCYMDYFCGEYGEKKHELMIAWTGKAWDEEYIKEFTEGDRAYHDYMERWFQNKLEEENAKRLADPEIGDVYREANGEPVDFTPKSWN